MKSIGVKLRKVWSCKSPSLRSSVEIFETFKRVFLTLGFFKVDELCSSKSTAPILLKFDTLFLHINYEVMLSIFFIFYNFNLFYNKKISDFLKWKIGILTSKCYQKLKKSIKKKHRNVTFFLGVCEDLLSMAHFCIIVNENSTEYFSNVILLYTHYINKYILTVSSKKIIVSMLLYSK